MLLKSLHDISELSELDTDIENVIITDSEIVKKSLDKSSIIEFSKIFRANLDKKFKTGDIILVTNEDLSIKSYCLITLICGEIVPYVISYVDYNDGVEINNQFALNDLEMLSGYPEFSDSADLIFFVTKLNRVFSESADSDFRKYISGISQYLDKGLWVARASSVESTDLKFNPAIKLALDKMNIPTYNNQPNLFESEGKLIMIDGDNVCGPYNLVRKIFCEVASMEGNEAMIYDNSFGELFVTAAGVDKIGKLLISYENEVAKMNAPKVIEKTEKQVENEILKNREKDIVAGEEDFLSVLDNIMASEKEKTKSKRKKKNEETITPKVEISPEEKELAIKETIMKSVPKVSISKGSKAIALNNAVKSKNAILNTPSESYPMDWNHVYSVGETSRMYNPTIGQRYDEKSKEFYADETQTKGMSIEDWNAYFIAHPELAHLIDETIGHLGGLFMDEDSLIKSGHLLYDAKHLKFAYRHEYLKGNVYSLIEDLEAIKDAFIATHSQEIYDKQIEALLAARPEMKKLNSADPRMVPFIHPLDEVILEYKTNQAAGITYTNNLNSRLMRAEQKRLEDEVKAGSLSHTEVPSMIEAFGGRLQLLPLTSFFSDWLSNQYGKIAEYGLPDIQMVRQLYFLGLSHKGYAEELALRGMVVIPSDKKPQEVVSSSDYFEAKDSAKRFVNDLFQEFLMTQVSEEDRNQIEYLWNKRYNGYANPDTWKLPVFIRHSKYFKNRKNKRMLRLSEKQIKAIKFATIENSSIMALEVGYGKTLVAIAYMSHCFETGQASNFMVTVPKTLFVNKKWREEVYGVYDEAKDKFIIGAVPQYNLIELGNASTSEIFGGGKSKYKTYSDGEENIIRELLRLFSEIGGRQAGMRTGNSKGTAVMPKTSYNYKLPVVTSNYSWTKLINIILPELDPALYNRCLGRDRDKHKAALDILANFNLGNSAKEKSNNIIKLAEQLVSNVWYYDRHIPMFGPDVPFEGSLAYDENTRKEYIDFFNKEIPTQYKKDKKGQVMYDANGDKIKVGVSEACQKYVLSIMEEIHGWIERILQRMSDFAIYEYGTWTFQTANKNIILTTKEAIANIGFSSESLEGVKTLVEEITTYKNEESTDSMGAASITLLDDDGQEKVFKRNPQKVLQKQLHELINRIDYSMTEEGPRGKFFLSNLKIDGFILDEAHIAKKIFTNVKTDASVYLPSPTGDKDVRIKTTSHDIKGGKAPDISLSVFGICQYIRSLGNKKPLMLLTATPFSNQPTEIFSMLSLVGINQLRSYGISNIKNFFDLFLRETLKYDFNQNGEFIKRITVEDFRNKELLLNLIWSVMDIKREANDNDKTEKLFGDKPGRKVFPKLISESSIKQVSTSQTDEDIVLSECEALGSVNTIAVLNRMNTNTCSIVDQNAIQKKMMEDIEKVATKQVNPKTLLNYTFEDFCPNISIFKEIEKEDDDRGKNKKSDQEETTDNIVVALRTILNSNIKNVPGAKNFNTDGEFYNYRATPDFESDKFGQLYFVKSGYNGKWELLVKVINRGKPDYNVVSREDIAQETIKKLTEKADYGTTFKALGISRAIALSPYLYKCNDLPEPTPENIIKYSPKIEYLVKALKSVKDYHINEIPKKIEETKRDLEKLEAKEKPTNEDLETIKNYRKLIPQLDAAREVSGQVVYMNMIRFNYYERDSKGKATVKTLNLAELIIQYLVDKGWFAADEVKLISSNTSSDKKEQYIKGFQEGKIKVLFGTPAIKEGVDLQNKASTMYIMTPDWNPTDMRQIEGRIWRRDNENRWVRIVYVLLDQSVEIFIYSKLEEKSARLKQIMKEREENGMKSLEDLEEMSLDPNQTKVALASNPEKRADIITKLCGAILEDQRNKVNKNREELRQVNQSLESVYENIEIAKEKYLKPYFENKAIIHKKYYDYLAKQVVDLYMNDRKSFFNRYTTNEKNANYDSNKPSNDPIFIKSMVINSDSFSVDSMLYPISTWDITEVYDLITGLHIMYENRDKFISEINNGTSDSITLINEYNPLRYYTGSKSGSERVNNYLFCNTKSKDIGSAASRFTEVWRMLTGPNMLYFMTPEMADIMGESLKKIKAGIDANNITRQQIRDIIEGAIMFIIEELKDYGRNHPHLRPENFGQYIFYKRKADTSRFITLEQFEAKDFNEQIEVMNDVFDHLREMANTWFNSFNVSTRREIMAGKNKYPSLAEILVVVDIAAEKNSELSEKLDELNSVFRPILRLDYTLKEIQRTLFKSRGMSMDDLPSLLEKFEQEYDDITNKIISLEASRLKLIERFEKVNKERESISIDDIVAEFAKTNNYLNYKLQEIK